MKKKKMEYVSGTDKPRRTWSYGWITVIASAVVLFTTSNLQYTFGVFLLPLIDTFGWSRAAVSGSVSCRSLVSAAINPIAGYLSDRYGAKPVILVGILFSGFAYIVMSRISNLWDLYTAMSVLMGLAIGATITPIIATVTRWFDNKAAFANGILTGAFGVAQILLPPTATYIILKWGWDTCFVVFGIIAWGPGILAWFFIKVPPRPEKKKTGKESDKTPPVGTNTSIQLTETLDYTLSEALHTRALWILLLLYFMNSICYQMVIIHIVAAAIDAGLTPEAAALTLPLSGIMSTLGRVGLGGVATRVGNKIVLIVAFAIEVPMLFLLAEADNIIIFYFATAVFTLAYGGTAPIIPTLAGSLFGTKSAGTIIGLSITAYTLGIAVGPFLAGYLFDLKGSYLWAFRLAGVVAALAFLLSFFLKPPSRRK